MTTPQPAELPEPLGWYVVNNIGMATLCKDEAEAQLLAEDCDMVYQRQAPHRAVQLVALQSQPAAAGVSDADLYGTLEAAIVSRYIVEKRVGGGFWGYCVKAGDGAQEIFVGHKNACEHVRQALQTACLDGAYMAHEKARAILALRPQAVPMAEAQRREVFMAGYEAAEQDAAVCQLPPHGWHCTRKAGHEGPCAAVETDDAELVQRGMDRLREAPHGITAQGAQGEQA